MTVGELIEELKKYNGDLEVYYEHYGGEDQLLTKDIIAVARPILNVRGEMSPANFDVLMLGAETY